MRFLASFLSLLASASLAFGITGASQPIRNGILQTDLNAAGFKIINLDATGFSFQPLDSDLTAIAALTTNGFGRVLLTKTDGSSVRTYIGAGTSSFDGVFASLSAKPSTIGGYGITDFNSLGDVRWQPLGSYVPTSRRVNTTSPLDGGGTLSSDLTISISAASAINNGYITAGDWNIFNGKQAASANLATYSGITPSANAQTILGHTFSQIRTDLGLVVGTNVQAWDADLDTWATKTPYAGVLTITTAKTLNVTSSITLSSSSGSPVTLNVGLGGTLGSAAFVEAVTLEPALGSPVSSGYVLSSTDLGVRSWISLAGYQPLDSDLTAIAALTTTSFGRGSLATADAAAFRTYIGAGTSSTTAPFTDTTAISKGSGDATKLLRFEVDGFTTTTTRVLTAPNYDGTITTLAGAEILSNKELTFITGMSFANAGGHQSLFTIIESLTGDKSLEVDLRDGDRVLRLTGDLTLDAAFYVQNAINLGSDGTGTRTLNIGAGGTLGSAAFVATSTFQPAAANLTTWATKTPYAGTLTITTGKTVNVTNTVTLSGTDGTTMTFPTTSATLARTDAANTFTGVQTMTSPVFTTPVLGTPSSGNGSNLTTLNASNISSGTLNAARLPGSTGTAVVLLSSTTVSTNVGPKQALYTVPASKKCIVTQIIARKASASLAAMGDALLFGFDVGAADYGNPFVGPTLAQLTDSSLAIGTTMLSPSGAGPITIGNAGDVFGCVFNDTSITATLLVDVFGYLTDAGQVPVSNVTTP
jgi:hypothetical protein